MGRWAGRRANRLSNPGSRRPHTCNRVWGGRHDGTAPNSRGRNTHCCSLNCRKLQPRRRSDRRAARLRTARYWSIPGILRLFPRFRTVSGNFFCARRALTAPPVPAQMQVSKRFLALLEQQLAQFTDRADLQALVVYVAVPGTHGQALPGGDRPLAPIAGPAERSQRRCSPRSAAGWPCAMRSPCSVPCGWMLAPWPDSLSERLEATARCLTEALRLDLEQQRLGASSASATISCVCWCINCATPSRRCAPSGSCCAAASMAIPATAPGGQPVGGAAADQPLCGSDRPSHGGAPALASRAQAPLLLPPALEPRRSHAGERSGPCSIARRPPPTCRAAPGRPPARCRPGAATAPSRKSWPTCWTTPSATAPAAAASACTSAAASGASGSASGTAAPPSRQTNASGSSQGVRGSSGSTLPGSGLGLALARDLAQSLGGDLSCSAASPAIDPHAPRQRVSAQLPSA